MLPQPEPDRREVVLCRRAHRAAHEWREIIGEDEAGAVGGLRMRTRFEGTCCGQLAVRRGPRAGAASGGREQCR